MHREAAFNIVFGVHREREPERLRDWLRWNTRAEINELTRLVLVGWPARRFK